MEDRDEQNARLSTPSQEWLLVARFGARLTLGSRQARTEAVVVYYLMTVASSIEVDLSAITITSVAT